jgi:FAD:protein FMN transferase
VGGDLRVDGTGPHEGFWSIGIEHPLDAASRTACLRLASGGVASTWRTRRSWGPPAARRHHVLDPTTGASAETGLAGVCALAADACTAEIVATAAFVAGLDGAADVLARHRAAGWLVDDGGHVHYLAESGGPATEGARGSR